MTRTSIQPRHCERAPASVAIHKTAWIASSASPSRNDNPRKPGQPPAKLRRSEADKHPAKLRRSEAGKHPAKLRRSEADKHPAKRQRSEAGWTPERRARHAAAIRRWAPWTKSTGPKTAAGKARSSRNAAKPHLKSSPDRLLQSALKRQKRYLADIARFLDLQKKSCKNELLKRPLKTRRKKLVKEGRSVTAALLAALLAALAWGKYLAVVTDKALIDADEARKRVEICGPIG